MKRYLAFYGDIYYPGGGMNDFIIDCDTVEDCEKAIKEAHIKNRPDDLEFELAWKQIYDTEKREKMDKEQKVQNLHVSQHSSNEMLSDVLSMEYPLIPMSEIDEEAREIAIRWAGESGMDWIGDKHKLASDIMNYARRYLKKENRLQLPIEIDGKRGMITSLYTINTGITIVNVDFDKPNPHWKAYTLECILKSEYNRGIYDQSKAKSEYD